MPDNTPNLNEVSLIWENRSRISVLEANQKNIMDTVGKIDTKVDELNEKHLPKLKEMISKTKWSVGIIAGVGSIIGSAIITEIIKAWL